MPFEQLGKVREALTVNTELYKKHLLRYLEARGYYVKATSDVESTFADAVLMRKDDTREYWLEVKATTVSLNDSDFLAEFAKYLAAYLARTRANRFKMIIACYLTINSAFYKTVFEQFNIEAIQGLLTKMVSLSEGPIRSTIEKANFEDVQCFFEDTDVKQVDLPFLLQAEQKIKPTAPAKPALSEVEYANRVKEQFGDVSPVKGEDKIFLNIFKLDVPSKINVATSMCLSSDAIFLEKPDVVFPAFDLNGGRLCCFSELTKDNPLFDFIAPDSVKQIDLQAFVNDRETQSVIIKILNRWVKAKCRKLGLIFDPRTKAYYYVRSEKDEGLITAKWKAPSRESIRELTRPMKSEREDKVNFWVHRSAIISAKNFWGEYFIQIKPRFLFSADGSSLYESDKADKLDRKFRKSKFSRNLNQFYDVLFWYRHVFPETEKLGNESIEACLGFTPKETIRLLEQVSLIGECKPNTEAEENLETLEKIDVDPSDLQTLDAYFGD